MMHMTRVKSGKKIGVWSAFHFQILGDFSDVFNRNAAILIDQIVNRVVDNKEIDILPSISRCTMDIISNKIKCLLELVSSDANVQIRFRPVLTISVCQSKENDTNVPPRFELGLPDSESGVLTITPWDRCQRALILICHISGVVVTSKVLIAVIPK
ncbi:hypothetical protein OUZ56_017270 [Daphnia magna]|uniref:Uncharacterized protein n=1 Tax=Daphnia magna TaxID=35525 RepID=A0ABR0ASJ3_9CRUS|nr:hypothetical protein OUZ56_017270 [Daphnia magna]